MAVIALCAACVSTSASDVALQSVEVVDLQQQSELHPPTLQYPKPTHLLKVTFATMNNLAQYARANEFTVGNQTYFCDEQRDDDNLANPYVYADGVNLDEYAVGSRPPPEGRGPWTYYIFIYVQRERPRESAFAGKPPLEAYDLRQAPKDVCFQLRGGDMLGFSHRSNVVKIPREAIAAALKAG